MPKLISMCGLSFSGKHALSFEHPTTEERPVVYDRTVAMEEWITSRLL